MAHELTFGYLQTKNQKRKTNWRIYDPENYNVETLFNRLDTYLKDVSDQLKKNISDPLKAYTKELWIRNQHPVSEFSVNARNHLLSVIKDELERQFDSKTACDAIEQFQQYPVIQTGPHCQLLAEPSTFYTSIFSAIGAKSTNQKFFFNYTCSTITLDGACKHGPGWLNIDDNHVNIFNLSRKALARTSVCSAPGPVSFAMKTDSQNLNEKGDKFYKNLIELTDLGEFDSIPEAFRIGNLYLWKKWSQHDTPMPLYFDDNVMAKLLRSHLTDPQSFVYKLLFSGTLLNTVQEKLIIESKTPTGNMLPNPRIFFLSPRKNKMRNMVLSGKVLKEYGNEGGNSIQFSQESLLKAIDERVLFPGLFLIFLMISLLPNVKVFGGLHQLAYYDLWRKILIEFCRENPGKYADEFTFELENNYNNGFGFHVLEDSIPIHNLLYSQDEGNQINQLIEHYSGKSLWNSSRSLAALRTYPRWGSLLCN